MIAYASSIREKAIKYRKAGHSLAEVARILHLSKSTASLWLKTVPLNKMAIKRLENKKYAAGIKGLKIIKNHRIQENQIIENSAWKTISSLDLDNLNLCKTLSALLYWGEGGKIDRHVSFVNSDPQMIATFMYLLRKSFRLDESKFRILVHIHEYHNDLELKTYWSQITGIPLSQFTKSYLKPHTGINKRKGFKGTIRINYYDTKIAREIKAVYNFLAHALLGT